VELSHFLFIVAVAIFPWLPAVDREIFKHILHRAYSYQEISRTNVKMKYMLVAVG